MFKFFSNKKAISAVEYTILFIIVLMALLAGQKYILRGIAGHWKSVGDSFGEGRQFDPRATTECVWADEQSRWYEPTCYDTCYNDPEAGYDASVSTCMNDCLNGYSECVDDCPVRGQPRTHCIEGCHGQFPCKADPAAYRIVCESDCLDFVKATCACQCVRVDDKICDEDCPALDLEPNICNE